MTKKRKEQAESPQRAVVLIIAPDTQTAEYLEPLLQREQRPVVSLAANTDGFTAQTGEWLSRDVRALVIAASPEMGTAQFAIVTDAMARRIPVIAWGFDRLTGVDSPGLRDRLLINTLLVQQGAALITDPSCISGALDLLDALPAFNAGWKIVLGTLPPGLQERLSSELETGGLVPCAKSKSRASFLDVTLEANTWCFGQKEKIIRAKGDPRRIAGILSLAGRLAEVGAPRRAASEPQPTEPPPAADIFLRPPSRILSETASKRLAAQFGITFLPEDLCQSATEALRFAAELAPESVVIKLVRPELENKDQQELVIKNVNGAAEIKQAIRSLSRRAAKLGPPEPLGFLIAPQIDGGVRLWASLDRTSRLGPVLLFGSGDVAGKDVLGAVDTSATADECARVLQYCGRQIPPEARAAFADVFARLCTLHRQCAPLATRVEAHPVVYQPGEDSAHALDMLVEITA